MSLSASQVRAVSPNLDKRAWLLRPVMADPPLCSLGEIKTVLNIDDIADLHELLDLKEHLAAKAQDQAGRPAR